MGPLPPLHPPKKKQETTKRERQTHLFFQKKHLIFGLIQPSHRNGGSQNFSSPNIKSQPPRQGKVPLRPKAMKGFDERAGSCVKAKFGKRLGRWLLVSCCVTGFRLRKDMGGGQLIKEKKTRETICKQQIKWINLRYCWWKKSCTTWQFL